MAGRHRGRGVDEQRDGDVLLLDEQLDEQPLEPRVDVPVELAQVVAEAVVAVVGELDRLATLDAATAALRARRAPATACSSSRRSSWRRKASSKTVGSTSLGRNAWRVPAAGRAGRGGGRGRRGPSIARSPPVGARLLDGRRDDRVEDGADDRLAGDALRLALEVEDDPVAQRRQGDRPDVVDRRR